MPFAISRDSQGYLDGAVGSGERVAKEIHRDLS
jgi:monoamine oxidase